MTLYEALSLIANAADSYAVFAKKPFSPDSAARIGPLDSELSTPADVRSAGFDYVIDTFSAQEAMEVFGSYTPSREEVSKFLLHYSVHDAFPGWVYQVQGIFLMVKNRGRSGFETCGEGSAPVFVPTGRMQ